MIQAELRDVLLGVLCIITKSTKESCKFSKKHVDIHQTFCYIEVTNQIKHMTELFESKSKIHQGTFRYQFSN